MNRKQYNSDTRYEKVFHNMELLGIVDITTNRQHRNGTVVWRLPIKNNHKPTSFIEVASFSTGYVRNQNSGYSNYQLNKRCQGEPEYFETDKKDWCGRPLYRQFTTRSCKLIPTEIDRLEYLISYCLKNYYIKRANQVVEGKYVSQWYHDWSLERANKSDRVYELESQVNCGDKRIIDLKAKLKKVKRECNQAYDCGLSDGKTKANETYSENTGAMARINDLEEKLDDMTECRDLHVDTIIKLEEKIVDMNDRKIDLENKLSNAISPTKYEVEKTYSVNLEHKLHNLQNKLATIERIANDRNKWNG